MAALDLQTLPPELRAALARDWPGCAEAQRRALLAPYRLGGQPLWPYQLWPWQPARRWWRPGLARASRAAAASFFAAHVSDVRDAPRAPRLFDPAQPFFPTPWTHAEVLLHSPDPEAFSDADFWVLTQRLCGGDAALATRTAQDWAGQMRAAGALHGPRRAAWLDEAVRRLGAAARGDFL